MGRQIFLWASFIAGTLTLQSGFADTLPTPQVSETGSTAIEEGTQSIVDSALKLIGIPYRRGGDNPDTGLDCSGFVDQVFLKARGMILPHSSREISKEGTPISINALKPGDLVFFHTLRRAFSHVGIYLGDYLFIHAPHPGATIGIADLRERYWTKRFSGARRIED
jgi:cell wall-associated NlpC family hydrolase